jgi:LuxR family transcriptional regulator, maltose regulon positive regulatory protein
MLRYLAFLQAQKLSVGAQQKQANLFVVSLDSQRRWYRYHALFAEALRYHLQQLDSVDISLLHLRAGRWYAGQGYLNEAIHHAS